ncbi:FAD/NAD(P)-binding domain-containing protein [Hypoxylon trugodes]|uniref:FAD/NAD(P)-binding domain-containing protein n=1 Tax=Hypoxylon trugodes TaxID=326681 RepID=UPI00219D951A|nr:FAD/NAD(P)-binding domain-containing protein [Hypoxylon trugodes]KAI1383046.1 FAD/NAD(P)-binding domain-containing protein [Hypoxylon trugodes]
MAGVAVFRPLVRAPVRSLARTYATSIPSKAHHRVVIVGGGTAGVTVAAQLQHNPEFQNKDIAILDPAKTHHYQPGWTLVGSGLRPLEDMHRPIHSVIPQGVKHYPLRVSTFDPENNAIKTSEGVDVSYDYLIVAPGLETNFAGISGLEQALQDPASQVSSIYSERTVEQVWRNIQASKKGPAIFTQPAGIIKCAGAPQKVMWMALSQWKRDGVRDNIDITFATGGPAMFAVPKYSQALEELRKQRNVEGLFQHNLVKVDSKNKVATFKNLAEGANGALVEREFGFLHVVPPQKPFDWVAKSQLADAAGWVDVDKSTTQHTKYKNVFSLGDASSLPNSKTAAAITAQAPVLIDNLLAVTKGKELKAAYDGYASCPLLTGHGELMLCEFKYGGVPKETFANILGGQESPNRLYYHLKKDFFPYAYWNYFVKGNWYGPSGFFKPDITSN